MNTNSTKPEEKKNGNGKSSMFLMRISEATIIAFVVAFLGAWRTQGLIAHDMKSFEARQVKIAANLDIISQKIQTMEIHGTPGMLIKHDKDVELLEEKLRRIEEKLDLGFQRLEKIVNKSGG